MRNHILVIATILLSFNTHSQNSSIPKSIGTMKMNAGIITDKIEETKEFYTKNLGLGVTFENEFYLLLHTPNKEAELSFLLPNHPSQQSLFQKPFSGEGMYLTIEVENVDEVYKGFKENGIEISIGIRNEPWGDRHFAITDPNGIGIDIVTYTAPLESDSQELKANKVTWFSIPSDDINRASKFYKEAFNWKIEPETKEANNTFSFHVALNSTSDENYISDEKGVINGCIVKREIGLPTPSVLVEVDDLDAAIAKVKKAGGQLVTDKIIMKSLNGVFVLIKDTEGNHVELFQNLQ